MDSQRRYRRPAREEPGADLQLIRMLICLVILGGVLLMRAFFPESTKTFLTQHIATGMDYTQVLTEVGDSVTAFFKPAPRPEDLPVDPSESPSPSPSPDTNAQAEPSPSPNLSDDIVKGKPDTLSGSLFAGMAPIVDASFLLSDTSKETDNTDPVPFGLVKPDRVDYTVYPLDFATQMPMETLRLTSAFAYREHPIHKEWLFHYGLDFSAPIGTAINAFAAGRVEKAGTDPSYGHYVILSHPGGYQTLYAHCSQLLVTEGQSVSIGQRIALVGATGVTTGSHLHFELRQGERLLNPASYLEIPDDAWAV